eukprot:2737968-Prymnesium_polylepis.1
MVTPSQPNPRSAQSTTQQATVGLQNLPVIRLILVQELPLVHQTLALSRFETKGWPRSASGTLSYVNRPTSSHESDYSQPARTPMITRQSAPCTPLHCSLNEFISLR